ncbi:MAG: chemotaxis response regulator protein-glutamate methylesterase [Nitrospiria bacterium]
MNSSKIKVLIIDDSPFVRQSISIMISETSNIEVMATVHGGLEAIKFLEKETPDVITLDIEMPEMNGFAFLTWLMQNHPLPVLVISSRSDNQNVFKALELGALEFIPKPSAAATLDLLNLKDELVRKIEIISKIPKNAIKKQASIYKIPVKEIPETEKTPSVPATKAIYKKTVFEGNAAVIVIGASTGGPAALQLIISSLPKDFKVPLVIVQHMPPNFTRSFAQRLDSLSKLRVLEAEEGELIQSGRVYVAPGGYHLTVSPSSQGYQFHLTPKDAGDRYIPSIDKTMISIANVYEKGVIGVILTGMGNDGTEGIKKIKNQGGLTLAESEETAVVYGMPRVPAQMGLIDRIFPINQMADQLIRICR